MSERSIISINMPQNCCSPYCEHWDECVALGIIKFKKIILQRPWEVTKSWCPSLRVENIDIHKEKEQYYKDIDLAYLAGFIDADGSIYIGSQTGCDTFKPKVAIYNRDKKTLDWMRTTFSSIDFLLHSRRKKSHWKPVHHIYLSSIKKCKTLLPLIIPYLKTKKEQAILLLEYCTIHKRGKISKRELEIFNKLKKLNSRGEIVQI